MRTQVRGTVTSDRNDKTIRVVVDRRFQHRMYGKIVRGRTICHTHDENNDASVGDVVEIAEARPRSAKKRWDLVRIVTRANPVQVAAVSESGDRASQEAFGAESGEGASESAESTPEE